MRKLPVAMVFFGLAVGGLLLPATASAATNAVTACKPSLCLTVPADGIEYGRDQRLVESCWPPACVDTVESGTLTLSVQSGQLTLGSDGQTRYDIDSGQLTLLDRGGDHQWSVQSGELSLDGVRYGVKSGQLTLGDPDGVQYSINSGTLTLGGIEYGIVATGIEY
jgi:hypothetical protein